MKKRILAIFIASLLLLTLSSVCTKVKAESLAHIFGRVTFKGIGVIGATVKAVGWVSEVQVKTKIFGFYVIHISLKRIPSDLTITAYTHFGEPVSKTIPHSYGGYYWMAFKL